MVTFGFNTDHCKALISCQAANSFVLPKAVEPITFGLATMEVISFGYLDVMACWVVVGTSQKVYPHKTRNYDRKGAA